LITYNKIIDSKVKLSKSNCINNNIEDAIERAKKFIYSKQNTDGSWEDFVNNAGVSNIWSTGYILINISDLQSGYDTDSIHKACQFLKNNKQGITWGYNTNWINDTDSTTYSLLGLSLNGYDVSSEHEIWLTYQKQNGGFSTYFDPDQISKALKSQFPNIEGWTKEHICVSAFAYYYLCKTKKSNEIKNTLWSFLEKSINVKGLWDSYWWTSPIYSTCFILQGLSMDHENSKKLKLKKTLTSLKEIQSNDGSFSDNFSSASFFFTALATLAMCSSRDSIVDNNKEILNAVKWLIDHQYIDGSFDSTYSLQIPLPDNTEPQKTKEWTKDQNNSTNVLTYDYSRLFTTSTVLKALDTVKKLALNNED
jgi:squalene cyclase